MLTVVSGIGPFSFQHFTLVWSPFGKEIQLDIFHAEWPTLYARKLLPVQINYWDVDPYDEERRFCNAVMQLGLLEHWKLRSILPADLPSFCEAGEVLLRYEALKAGNAEVTYLRQLCKKVERLPFEKWRLGGEKAFAQMFVGEVDEDLLVDAVAKLLLDC